MRVCSNMEITNLVKLQNMKSFLRRFVRTLSIFNEPKLKKQFLKQLYCRLKEAKKMQSYYANLALPLQSILTIAIRTQEAGTPARECFLRRMYVVTRELSDCVSLYRRHREREEKLLALKQYLNSDMVVAQQEYVFLVEVALRL